MPGPDPLFSTHAASGRTAIIDQAGEALWLYLTQPGTMTPETDCWLANLPLAGQAHSHDELRAAGLPPPAPSSVRDDKAGLLPADPSAYELKWSADGTAVSALANGEPVAFVIAAQKAGFHRCIRVICPWGQPFDEGAYRQLFG